MRTRIISKKEQMSEFMLGAWSKQCDLTICKYVVQAMAMNEIEDSNFFVTFMQRPKPHTIQMLEDCEKRESKYNKSLRKQK